MTRTLTGGRYDSDDASRGCGDVWDEIRYDGGSERGYMEREDVGKTAMLQRRNTTMSNTSSTMSSGDKFKIKCHYTDTRILLVPVNVTFDDLSARDVDDELVLMTDQEDLEVAFEMSGLEYGVIWCFAT
ncbi:hypothetical protein BC829DRAFT_384743 [Chytridium lagenaria]|nr:hypothetical protein BC829DRAFT_384743 [Chytridium lagenaria]